MLSDASRDPEDVKKDILTDTGMVTSLCEHGTHYIVNSKITLETLERIRKYMYKRSCEPSSGPGNLPFQSCHHR
ncbi:MAG: hypothetical protein WBF33_17040 [Candidatus Nitrosopolaris sp.]